MSLFDLMNSAQNGRAMELVARQFKLSTEQAQLATEALMPAFSQGLKRNAADPYGISAFVQAMASGNHQRYFEDASRAFAPEGLADGNGILGHLFGSKELSRAVAAQAAQATGIGEQILQQMLPVMATMIMGGLFKQSTGQMPGSGGANLLGSMIEQMMRFNTGNQTTSAPGFDPFGANPFGKVMQDMMAGGQNSPGSAAKPTNPFAETPWGQMMEGMMRGLQPKPAPEPEKTNPSGRPRNPYDDLFGDMFETGQAARDDYQRKTEAIFDQFLKNMEKHRSS